MNPSRLFIQRPVATTLLMVAILLAGGVAYYQLPVSALPQVDYPTIQVQTFYPGASPDVMASAVTSPLERQFAQIPGLAQLTSTSSYGCSQITLRFVLELKIDVAAQEVQAAINAATNLLPRDLPNPPTYTKSNPADAPVLTLALTSDTLPLSRVQDLAETRFAQKISQVAGVGLVSVSGGAKPAIRIQVNPTALSSLGLTLDDLRTTLGRANVNQAKGSVDGEREAYIIGANDQLVTSAEYRALIVAYRGGSPVYLRDVATIEDGVENEQQAAWMNDRPAVILNVQRQPGANTIEVVDRIRILLPILQESLPGAVTVHVLADRTDSIRASVADVQRELLTTILLVILVIFVFLRSVSATVIPSVAVPLSIVGTFGVMYLLGYSLNNLTLMALTISTGFVVDDAIVMVENIMRYVEQGESPLRASLQGARQVGFTIVSLSVSLIAVLIPLLFMEDIVGRLFREFAVTLSVAIVVSAFVSLTLTPTMCALLLRPVTKPQHGHDDSVAGLARLSPVTAAYGWTLRRVLANQRATILIFLATLFATVWLYVIVPKGFFPLQDTGLITGITAAPETVSFTEMVERQRNLQRALLADPAVESLSSFVGIDGISTTLNSGRIQIRLRRGESAADTASATPATGLSWLLPGHAQPRHEALPEVMQRLQERAAAVQGIEIFLQPVQDLTVETRLSRTQFQYTLEGPHPETLRESSAKLVTALRDLPELADVASDDQSQGLQLQLNINRDAAARLGITPQMIDDALYSSFGQRQVSIMFTQLNQYRLVLEVQPQFRDQPIDLNQIYLRSPGGTRTPLSSVVTVEERSSPLAINHQGLFHATTISFNLSPGVSLGAAVAAVTRVKSELGLPESLTGRFQGTAQAFQSSLRSTPLLILASLITVYIVLGVLYESYVHPLTILSTLPSAGVGAILALLVCRLDLSIIALIGIILLIGIVKKNAIMMIDFALDRQRQDGVSPEVAIYEACLLRFRPIMMTTLAAVFGAVPLALSQGTGSELRQPLGITIIGGLVVSQILTLYTTPVIYLWFDWLSRAWGFDPAGLVQIPEPDDDRFSAVDAGEDLDFAGQAAPTGGPA